MSAGMRRLPEALAALGSAGRTALIPYVTAGDPFADATPEILHALVEGGADVIELGVPFSDPMADGPVIQKASERALMRGIGLGQVLAMVRGFRERDSCTPLVLMGYANPFERYGLQRFVDDASDAGVDGVLVVDYPPEECAAFVGMLRERGIDPIFLLAPTSSDERMRRVGEMASGYVYYVSLKGVTGAGHMDVASVAEALPRIRRHVSVPVGVGFGIRDAATARRVAEHADAVVIGSALVEMLATRPRDAVAAAARAFAADIRAALDARSTE